MLPFDDLQHGNPVVVWVIMGVLATAIAVGLLSSNQDYGDAIMGWMAGSAIAYVVCAMLDMEHEYEKRAVELLTYEQYQQLHYDTALIWSAFLVGSGAFLLARLFGAGVNQISQAIKVT